MDELLAHLPQLSSASSLVQEVGDRIGTFAFAVSGALLAVSKRFDIVGIAVLAVATAVGGGIARDVIINRHPPVAFTDLSYIGIALAAALMVFIWHPPDRLTGRPLDTADALGLGVFCVTGTLAAAQSGLSLTAAAILGTVTAVGGGVFRDLLANEIPRILRRDSEIYAIPAILGSGMTALLIHFRAYPAVAGVAVILAVFALRVAALRFGWHAPRACRRR